MHFFNVVRDVRKHAQFSNIKSDITSLGLLSAASGKSVSFARGIYSTPNVITFLNADGGNNPKMKIDSLTFGIMKNLANGNAYIKSMTLNYSSNPWQIVFKIEVDGNEFTKTIQLG